tara:strand:+ start:8096 stop:8242 length:147 start_codon:yes stop_codon:yes gene_type:complete
MECHIATEEFYYFMLVLTRDSQNFNKLHADLDQENLQQSKKQRLFSFS